MTLPVTVPAVPLGRRFITVWAGQALSSIGSMLSGVGIGVWVFLETGSAAWLGALIALATLPAVILMPAMRAVDRLPRRRIMIGADVVAAAAALAILVLATAGSLEVWHLAVTSFVGGAGGAFQFPAFQAAIPALVEPGALARANGLTQFGPAIGVTVGPLLAAPVVGWWGIEGVVVIDLVTFAIAVATVVAVEFDDRAGMSDDRGESPDGVAAIPADAVDAADAAVGDLDDGSWRASWRWLRGPGRALLALLVTMSAVNLVLSGFNVAALALAVELGGTDLAGVPLAAGGVGMIVGSLAIGARGLPTRRVRAFASALAVFAVSCWVAASRPSLWLLTVGLVAALATIPVVSAAVATLFHERVPAGMHGRVFATRAAISQSLGPVGSLGAGALIASFAEPAMEPGAWGAQTVGRLIGDGAERGPAFVIAMTGIVLALLALGLASSWIADELDVRSPVREERPTAEPTTVDPAKLGI